MSKLILENWLNLVGFHSNPFGSREAESEGAELGEFFVEYPYFDEVLGSGLHPMTTFLFAERGCGKTANRCMIEDYCRSQRIEGDVLAIPYTDFRSLLRSAGGTPAQITQSEHIHEILRQGVIALIDHLLCYPQLAEQLYDGNQPQWFALVPSTYLTPPFVNRLLREVGCLSIGLTATELQRMVRERKWGDLLAMVPDEAQLTIQVLALLSAQDIPEGERSPSPVEQIKEFIDLLRFLGFDAAYVLVDRVDELPGTSGRPQSGVDLLQPLLNDLVLMELPHLAFKFFLPAEMQSGVKAIVRTDRITSHYVTWSDDDLHRLLETRLRVFSDDRIESLSQVSKMGLKDMDDRLVEQAAGSPRNLIRLGEFIFSEHCRLPVEDRIEIDAKDWHRALRRYWSELGLSVDAVSGRVTVAGRELPADELTPREYEVIQFLYENAGRLCTKSEIAEKIYGPKAEADVSSDAIDQAVSRLRKKIEPSDEPLFVVTIPGKGYRLDHAKPSFSNG